MTFTDSHAHIYAEQFDEDREYIIKSSLTEEITKIYMPNIDLESIDGMLKVEEKFPTQCIPMMGLHPCYVNKDFEKQLYEMESWIQKRSFSAIGETGLDLYWDKTFFEQQKESLRIQIGWAKEKGWPLVIHCRESMEETLAIIEEEKDKNLKGIFHCFSGTIEQAQRIIACGFYLGIGGVVTYKNGGLDTVLAEIGLENLVLETDAPYLSPAPHRGKRNSPLYLPLIAQRVADLTENDISIVSELTQSNVQKIFNNFEA
jgi:TatD DNase family protein